MTFSGFRSTFTDHVRAETGGVAAAGISPRWGAIINDEATVEIVSGNNVGPHVLQLVGLNQSPTGSLFSGFTVDLFDTDGVQDADVDVIVLWRITQATVSPGVALTFALIARAAGDVADSDETFYALEYDTASTDGMVLSRVNSNVRTAMGSEVPFTAVQNEWYYAQLRVQGDQISGRFWTLGDVPPAVWQLGPETDSTITASGWAGWGTSFDVDHEIDFFSIATEGDDAQLPLNAPTPETNQLTASPSTVRADASSLLVWVGEPFIAIDWALSVGDGSLAVLTDFTDAAGKAFARYDPGTVGTKTVEVTHGT